MAGLLDISEDQILGGLLGAGAASGAKGNFLARMAAGIGEGQKFGAWREQKARQRSQDEMQAEFRALQKKKMEMEMTQAEAAALRKTELSDMTRRLFGGSSTMSPGAFNTPAADGVGPVMPASQAGGGGFSNASIDQIALLKALGGPDMVDAHKYANDPLKLEQGSTYKNRNTGAERFMPKLDAGIIPDGNGGFTVAPGYANANANIKGAETSAVEGARAGFDFTDVPQSDGTSVKMPRAQALQLLGARPAPGPQQGPQPTQPNAGSGYSGGSRDVANAESIRIMQSELQNPNLSPSDRAGVTREIARLQGTAAPKLGVTQSPADAIVANGAATAAVTRDATNEKDAKLANRLSSSVDRALALLDRGPTESGFGTVMDKTASFFGGSPKGAQIADQLRTLSGWMVANVPRMEGPQSNFDVANYQTMAGIVGDSTIPVPRRKAAAMEVKRLQEKYAELNGRAGPSEQKPDPAGRTVKKTGMYGGKKVIQYSDGSTEYAN